MTISCRMTGWNQVAAVEHILHQVNVTVLVTRCGAVAI